MADEADSGITGTRKISIAASSSATTSSTGAKTYLKESSKLTEDPDNETEKVSGSNPYFEATEGSSATTGTVSAGAATSTIFRCERCDKFEAQSHASLLIHSVECTGTGKTGILTGLGTVIAGSSGSCSSSIPGSSGTSSSPVPGCAGTSISKLEGDDNSGNTLEVMGSPASADSDKLQQSRKLFECDVCNMKFSNGANMRRHKMRHTGVKPYECRVCQKRFFRKDHLAEHFTTHTKTLPYHCPICNRGFQRQIAMRAHFQNEHVGQHDLVKTCPLCSYRAGTMKSLRVHFFNRHGIDLDNPGPGAPSSLLLALDPQNAGQFLPQLNPTTLATTAPSYSDSGDSIRSAENATPPMHFLTPHVEISMAENTESFNAELEAGSKSSSVNLDIKVPNGPNGLSPSSPKSIDSLSNVNIPTSSHTLASLIQSPRTSQSESHISPSISLIPIKQEPITNEDYLHSKISSGAVVSGAGSNPTTSDTLCSSLSINTTGNSNNPSSETVNPSTSLATLIKVSPLKSLLREDLKRRICARASNRPPRIGSASGASSSSSGGPGASETTCGNTSVSSNVCGTIATTTTTNGVITSTGPEAEFSAQQIRKGYLQCLFCGIEFPDQTLYFLHKGCHSESNPWKCNICGEQCNNVYEFNSHLLSKSHQ